MQRSGAGCIRAVAMGYLEGLRIGCGRSGGHSSNNLEIT